MNHLAVSVLPGFNTASFSSRIPSCMHGTLFTSLFNRWAFLRLDGQLLQERRPIAPRSVLHSDRCALRATQLVHHGGPSILFSAAGGGPSSGHHTAKHRYESAGPDQKALPCLSSPRMIQRGRKKTSYVLRESNTFSEAIQARRRWSVV